MFKKVTNRIWFYDSEYVPDIDLGRKLYKLSPEVSDAAVLAEMYKQNGATEETPKPMLKMMMYRVVSISVVERVIEGNRLKLNLRTLPNDDLKMTEDEIVGRFLTGVGKKWPQLVGFASSIFDFTVLFQRALINKCVLPEFCIRPDKPWEGVDYFAKGSDHHVDLLNVLGVSNYDGKCKPKLDEIAVACGIPGKQGMSGADVADAYFAGQYQDIVNYNECDALTTYLLWLELARMAGFITLPGYENERAQLRDLLSDRAANGAAHLEKYLLAMDEPKPKTLAEEMDAAILVKPQTGGIEMDGYTV